MNTILRILDFSLGCLRTPAFFAATFLIYMRWIQIAINYELEIPQIVRTIVIAFFDFIRYFFEAIFIIPIEILFRVFDILIYAFFATNIGLGFPSWYPYLAYISTVLYGAQRASVSLYSPLKGYSLSANEKEEYEADKAAIGAWPTALLEMLCVPLR
jgi:hypothetical protein